jgi:hypothetical protein
MIDSPEPEMVSGTFFVEKRFLTPFQEHGHNVRSRNRGIKGRLHVTGELHPLE